MSVDLDSLPGRLHDKSVFVKYIITLVRVPTTGDMRGKRGFGMLIVFSCVERVSEEPD